MKGMRPYFIAYPSRKKIPLFACVCGSLIPQVTGKIKCTCGSWWKVRNEQDKPTMIEPKQLKLF